MKNLDYSLRYLLKRRGNSLTRLVSLTLGLVVALLIFSYVGFNLTYDRFLPDRDRVWQVWVTSPKFGMSDKMVRPLAPNLAADMPQVEAAVHMIDSREQVTVGDNLYDVYMWYVGSDFFDVLDYGVVSGDPHRILSAEGRKSVMISERMAARMFGHDDPLGKTVMFGKDDPRTVEGVFRTPPANNSLGGFDMLGWLWYDKENEIWGGQDSFPTYIKLVEGADIASVESAMEDFDKRHGIYESNLEWNQSYMFVPLTQSHFTDNTLRRMQYIFSVIGLVALLVACLNYVLLTISSLSERSRTIAMLRCSGAQRTDVFAMLMNETSIMAAGAVVCAAFVIWCFEGEIEQITGIGVTDMFALSRIWIPLTVCVAAFVLCGVVPAALFSAVDLQYAFRRGGDNRVWWKRSLLFVQTACAAGVVIFLGICVRQLDYIRNADYGYEHDKVVTLTLVDTMPNLNTVCNELSALPCVEGVGMSDGLPVWGYPGQTALDESGDLLFSCRWECWSAGYVPAMGMTMAEGRNFRPTDGADKAIVNEAYVLKRGWEDSAVGKTVYDSGGAYEVVGVVEDFLMGGSSALPIVCHPSVVYKNPERRLSFCLSIRLTEITPATLDDVKRAIDSVYEGEFRYEIVTFDNHMENMFTGERRMRNIMTMVCVITLIIALSGLVGYVDNEMARRRKEIALRKVAGASSSEVLRMVCAGMTCMALPAVAAGIAAAFYGGGAYLAASSAMRCTLPWWLFAAGGAAVLAVVYGVTVVRTWRTAASNPIEMIKAE